MDSLLTLSVGDYRSVELVLRLVVALVAMTALLLGFSTCCVTKRFRFPLILSSIALLGAAWFESGVWLAWKGAFELAGSSYCVTGQLLAGEDRIIAWVLAIPLILLCFGLFRLPPDRGADRLRVLTRLSASALLLAVVAPFSSFLTLLILGWIIWFLCLGVGKGETLPFTLECRLASGSIGLAFLITLLGGWHLLPLGKSADGTLVRGEIIRSLCDLLSFVVPPLILLAGVLRISSREQAANS